jgi:hypothetical protein
MMPSIDDETAYLSRSTDHVANIASQLADLVGYPILAYELIQNADDAKAALLQFRVLEDRLEVWNDAVFSDCGTNDDVCPWGTDGPVCDFHSFRLVASGNKARRHETTGKFGIGFITVYQITDHPELVSGGRHWILDERAPENRRIKVCHAECGRDHDASGTLFVLPYAMENTAFRLALKVRPLAAEDPEILASDLSRVSPDALLFLRNVELIEIERGGRSSGCERTATSDGRIQITDGTSTRSWRVLEASFTEAGDEVRAKYEGLIEEDRISRVRVAVSDAPPENGLLYAGLPTQTSLPTFPVRIDAEFFPTRDRKSVHLGKDHRGAWNKAALGAAAKIIATRLETIFDVIGPEETWRLIQAAHRLFGEAERKEVDPVFGEFWTEIVPCLPYAEIVPVFGGHVRACSGLLLAPVRQAQASIMGLLGIDVPEDSVWEILLQLPQDASGAARMSLADVVQACEDAGLTESWTPGQAGSLFTRDELDVLLQLIQSLSGRLKAVPDGFESIALVPCESGRVCPLTDVCRLDTDESRDFLLSLNLGVEIADASWLDEKCPFLLSQCLTLDPEIAVRLLNEVADNVDTAQAVLSLRWLNGRRSQIPSRLSSSIKLLPLFPAAGGLRPLAELALPGGYEDPLGLASVVDMSSLSGLEDFLEFLGARQLDTATYILEYAAPQVRSGGLDADQARKLVEIIAIHKPELEEVPGLQEILQALPIISCTDGTVRPGNNVYFQGADVAGWDVPRADSRDDLLGPRLTHAYEWLGVARQARVQDINARVKALARVDVKADLSAVAEFIFALSRHDNVLDWLKQGGRLNPLKIEKWLPDRSGKLFRPESIYPVFQEYLFATQGPFIGIPRQVQNKASDLLYAIGVPREVPVGLIIKHLQECSSHGLDINSAVYSYLAALERNGSLGAEQLVKLQSMAFIQTGPGEYHQPSEVFWDESPFGCYSVRLGESLREYAAFLDKVGVKSAADHRDAIRVLKKIAVDWRSMRLEDEQIAVVHSCWARIQRQLTLAEVDEAEISRELAAVHCIPDARSILERPETLFFPDPAGIGARSALLPNSLIDRRPDTWIAYQAAGVRNIASILFTTVELEPPEEPDSVLPRLLAERNREILRVLEAQEQLDPAAGRTRLAALQFCTAAGIRVRHELRALGQVDRLEPVQVESHYEASRHRLIWTGASHPTALNFVARELARALDPGTEGYMLAGNLLHVLTALDAAAASQLLSTLGIPVLSDATPIAVTEREASALGAEDGSEPPASQEGGPFATGTDEEEAESWDSGSAMGLLESGKSADGAEEPIGEEERSSAGSREQEPGTGRSAGRGGGGSGRQYGRATRRAGGSVSRQSRMLSYVLHGDTLEEQVCGDEAADWSDVDKAGVQAVTDYEIGHGRRPSQMAHNHPGFDIESADEDGKVVRRIEVKSLEGAWGVRGVALTRRQFAENYNEGPLYWLYVVEYATTPEKRKVYPVPDPADNVTAFMFDSGWAGMAVEAE